MLLPHFHQRKGIHPCTLHPHSPMEMRPSNPSGRACQSKKLSIRNDITALYIDSRKVGVEGIHAQTVIEDDGVSREEKIFRQGDAAAIRRMDWCSRTCVQIGARVWSPRLSVENATVAEVCPAFTIYWNTEGLIPEQFGANGRENGFSLLCFAVCAGEVRLAELNVFFIDFELRCGIFLRFNFDHSLTFFDAPIVQCKEHRRDVFTGFRVEVHGKNGYPA